MSETVIGPITPWALEELQNQVGSTGLDCPGFLIRDGDSYYVDSVVFSSGDVSIEGSLTIFGETARRVALAVQIESAETVANLPAGLVDADEDIRDLAREKFEELEV